ncbi:hypothetical protein GCM10017771_05450 [Streptomyces capitiformicae]|uniref:Uncharacterized protein n=1 Tax=Streptomyces capitiformicae TaxID=2014920 RepID=A0A919GCH7_9ACTN|nr:hypothetical protein GCM10017771_05450 [Streptomyces capitiformicae]
MAVATATEVPCAVSPRETAYDIVGAPASNVVSAATATYLCIRAMVMNGQPP